MSPTLVPRLDPTPLPGPPGLFHFLLVLTFFLHLLFMNLTLGGTLLAAVGQLRAGGEDDFRAVLARRLMGVNTYAISLTITTGIAPLLFIQLLYQPFFYSATILLGWIWLGMLGMLMAGYYAAYVYKFRVGRKGGGTWLAAAALLFLLIAMIHVAVHLIHAQPERWAALAGRPWAILGDPMYWSRLLHFLFAAVGFSALVAAWWAVRRARSGREPELNARIAGHAWQWALWTALLQVFSGFLLFSLLPRPVLLGLLRGGSGTVVPLAIGVGLGLALPVLISRVRRPVRHPRLVDGALAIMALGIAVMSVTRHQVRVLYLDPSTSGLERAAVPQWGNITLFGLLLVAGLAVVAVMVRAVLRNPASGAEAA